MEGREREGPKLLLNQGPSEPCYATARGVYFFASEAWVIDYYCVKFVYTCNRSTTNQVWHGG